MLFNDYVNENIYLYDNIDIDINTINFLNYYFARDYVFTKDFDFYYRNDLKLHLPYYYKLVKAEMLNDLLCINDGVKYRRLAEAKVQNSVNTELAKNKYEGTSKNTSESKVESEGSDSSNSKQANKESPMSTINEGGSFNNLFNWKTAGGFSEANTENENENTETTTGEVNLNENSKTKNLKLLKGVLNNLNDIDELETTRSQLVVDAVDKIINFLWKENKAHNYLIEKLKKDFVSVYEI